MDLNQAFNQIRTLGTNGINCDVTTENIIERLSTWSKNFEFDVLEIDYATVKLAFKTMPKELRKFCEEVYEFCPDTIDQGYGCLMDLIEIAEAHGQQIPPENLELMEGLDPDSDDFGLEVMQRDLLRTKTLTLWWD
ncbi:DUF4253 domain-containing protein [[Leptolyngbya] sp. PCC 7376]|uniref:DUF4253 domain-containing protein n=1 Tax=[Leptolyngbya] sp. PCC 7376 TaxID=111781 RepID=UPI0002F35F13|nr:DUF4253 domain-containing protein [[Leptolyngbya] sp. PCC 7376]